MSDTRGVNELINPNNVSLESPDGAWIQSDGYILFDENLDGVYDHAWRGSPQNIFYESTDGQTWYRGTDPIDEMMIYHRLHPEWLVVEG